jgi:O-antigen/teichoic acid export membrane protein
VKLQWPTLGNASAVAQRLSLSFVCSMAIFGSTAIAGIVLARTLGPELRGEFATIILWPTLLVALGSLGFVEATTYVAANAKLPFGHVLGTSLLVAVAQAALLIVLGFGLIALLFGSSEVPLDAFRLNLLSIPLGLLGTYALGALNGAGKQSQFQLGRTTAAIVACVLIVVLALFDQLTVMSAVCAYLAGALVMAAIALFWSISLAPISELRWSRLALNPLFHFGIRSYVSSVPIQLNYRVDQLLISVFMQPIQLGLYVTAATMTYLTQLVGTSIQMVALPTVAAARSTAEMVRLARTYLRWCLAITVALTVPIFLLMPFLVETLFGSDFDGAVTPGRILLVGTVGLSVRSVLDGLLKGVGRPLAVGVAEGIALVFTVAALPVALHYYGITGAAWVSLIAYTLSAVAMSIQFARATEISARSVFSKPGPADPPDADPGDAAADPNELSAETSVADEQSPGGEQW